MVNNADKYKAYNLREQGCSWTYIGSILGVDRKTAKRWVDSYSPNPYIGETDINIDRFKPLHIYGDAVISCDWHIPLHSTEMVNSLFQKAIEYKINQLVVAGDFFNLDTFSHFKPYQIEAAFELERTAALEIMDAALDHFDTVWLGWGNHDFRIAKFLDFKLSYEYCIRWILEALGPKKLDRIHISNLDHLIYHPGNYDLRLCHQNAYNKNPLTIARELAYIHEISILTAHSHQFAQGVARNGKHLVFEGGGLFDSDKTEYIQRTTTHPKWVQGFYIWKQGICYPFSPTFYNL